MGTAALVLAGGRGTRMRRRDNKVFAHVAGEPLIVWSVRAFASCGAVDELVLVTREGEHERVAAVVEAQRRAVPVRLTVGGATRTASEVAGLDTLADEVEDGTVDVVMIHDAARPFVSPRLIAWIAATAREVGGAVPSLPLDDDVYRSVGVTLVQEPGRLHRVQTPQAFRAAPLLDAYRRAAREGFTGVDTAEVVERYTDLDVAVVAGERTNIKVTYADDLATAERTAAGHGQPDGT